MSDYALVRTRSAIIRPSIDSPRCLISRTYSVPDLTSYVRGSDRYKPQWLFNWQCWGDYFVLGRTTTHIGVTEVTGRIDTIHGGTIQL